MSRDSSRNLKENFQNHKWKQSVSQKLYHGIYTKKLDSFLLITNHNIIYGYRVEVLPKPSEDF